MMAGDVDPNPTMLSWKLYFFNLGIFLMVLVAAIPSFTTIHYYEPISRCVQHLMLHAKNPVIAILWMVILMALGGGLFIVRTNFRRIYAVLEGGFALASSWVTIARLPDAEGLGAIAVLGATVYLFVRALDNWREGNKLARERRQPRKPPARRAS